MISKQRVFHIDQECFIIYAEDLSTKKERFLRIGNSKALKRFGCGFTFLSLITPIFPGDAFGEPEIFTPDVDKRIIGLQNVVDRFVNFLRLEGVDTNTVIVSRADGQGRPTGKKLTENQFLNEIKDKPKSNKHSFAAFYEDGNIRIFNQNQLMFDLNESLEHTLDEPKEINLLSKYFSEFYKQSYAEDGFVYSGRSLFFFSQNDFACITQSSDWVRDAVNVGIEPANVSFLYITSDANPNSLWLKTFLQRKKNNNDKKIRLVINDADPNWLNLVSQEIFSPVYPCRQTVEVNVGKLELFFQNERIGIYRDSFKLHLNASGDFLAEGSLINASYIVDKHKRTFNLTLGQSADGNFIIRPYSPVIFASNEQGLIDFDIHNPDLKQESLLVCQHLGVNSNGDYVLKNKLLSKSLVPIEKSLNPYCFFENDYDLAEIEQKYEQFNADLANSLSKEQIISINTRYEKMLRDKQFYLDEQKRLLDFMEILDNTEPNVPKQKSDGDPQKQNVAEHFEQKSNGEPQRPNVSEHSEQKLDGDPQKSDEAEHSKQKSDGDPQRPNVAEHSEEKLNEPSDSFNAEELLTGGRFDEYADDVKQMNVGSRYEFKDSDANVLFGGHSDFDDSYGKRNGNLWWILIIILLLLLFCFLGFLIGPKYIWHKRTAQEEFIEQMQNKYPIEENSLTENVASNDNIPDSFNETVDEPHFYNGSIHSVKTSFYYKFHMTTADQIALTNEIARSNGYDEMGSIQNKKYSGRDPHWIYPGNIITMPDGNNVTVGSGDTLWSLCENFLIDEINGYELEVRNILEATKHKVMTTETAKTQFRRIHDQTHSVMIKDFMNALLSQRDFDGWQSDIVVNQ